jgi:hypothetical protein
LSDLAHSLSAPLKLGAYALTALLLAGYALVLWWVVHPAVPDSYRAYYIDQTTTCMNQPVPGTYTLGTMVSYLPDGFDAARPTKPCGWEGPAGDGTHAVGTSSRLRFVWTEPTAGPLTLSLDLIAIEKAGQPMPQQVDVLVNNEHVATLHVNADAPNHFDVKLPADLVAQGRADLLLEFPTAVRMGPTDPPTRWRSIKLLAAGLMPST